MTTTKELLTLAARAIGYEVSNSPEITHDGLWITAPHIKTYWNPATNSGDSRDLQVQLKITLEYDDPCWYGILREGDNAISCKDIVTEHIDPNMAVLLVAAELGKAMVKGDV